LAGSAGSCGSEPSDDASSASRPSLDAGRTVRSSQSFPLTRFYSRLRALLVDGLQILVVQDVSELIPLGGQIAPVLLVGSDLDRHLLDHLQPEAVDARELPRIVREDADRGQPEVGEDLVADAVLARILGQPELDVGLDGVHPLLLQLVRLELVEEPDAAALLGHVEEDAAALARDLVERLLELLAAVAAQRVEDVAREAFG